MAMSSFVSGFLPVYQAGMERETARKEREKQIQLSILTNALDAPETTQEGRGVIYGQLEGLLGAKKGTLTSLLGNLDRMVYGASEAAPENEGAPTFRALTEQEKQQFSNNQPFTTTFAGTPSSAPTRASGGVGMDAERPLSTARSGDAELPLSSRIPVRGSVGTIGTPTMTVTNPQLNVPVPDKIQTSVDMRDFYQENGLPPKPLGRYGDLTNADIALQQETKRAMELQKIKDIYDARNDERTRKMYEERDKRNFDSRMALAQTKIAADYAKLKDTQEWKADFDANKEINRRAQTYITQGASETDARLQAANDLADEVALKRQAKELGLKNVESQIKLREDAARRGWANLEFRVKSKEMEAAKIPRGEIGVVRAEANKANTFRKEVATLQGQVAAYTEAVKQAESDAEGMSGFALQQQQQIINTRKTQLAIAQNKLKASQDALTASEDRLKPYEQYIEKTEKGYYGVNPNTATPTLSGGGVPSRSGGGQKRISASQVQMVANKRGVSYEEAKAQAEREGFTVIE